MRGPNADSRDVSEGPSTSTLMQSEQTVLSKENEQELSSNKGIWNVGKMLVDSLSKGKMRKVRIFGAPLEDLPLDSYGIPMIVHRLCCFLEQYGLKDPEAFVCSKKQTKLLERCKISFERAGDADLENDANVRTVGSLLNVWLRELPSPLVPVNVTSKLIAVCRRYGRNELRQINEEISNALLHTPVLNLRVLYIIFHMLNEYNESCDGRYNVEYLCEVFSSSVTRETNRDLTFAVGNMMMYFNDIFNDRIMDKIFKFRNFPFNKKHQHHHCVRDNAGCKQSSQTEIISNRFVRSNSEEKLSPPEDHVPSGALIPGNNGKNTVMMRRVNSHEDFGKESHHHHHHVMRMLEFIAENDRTSSQDIGDGDDGMILNTDQNNNDDRCATLEFGDAVCMNFNIMQVSDEVQVAQPPLGRFDNNEQEERRNTERFAPQYGAVNRSIRKHAKYNYESKSKFLNYKADPSLHDINKVCRRMLTDHSDGSDNDDRYSSFDARGHYDSFEDEINTSPSSNSSDSLSTSPVKSPTLSPQRSRYSRSDSEPLISFRSYNLATRRSSDIPLRKDRSILPRHSAVVNRSVFVGTRSDSFSDQRSIIELKILNVSHHIKWLRKKMQCYEEDYFTQHGQFVQKASDSEYKQMSGLLMLLKNNLKQLRKEAGEYAASDRSYASASRSLPSITIATNVKEDAVKQAEKSLQERRILENRPENVEQMTHEQLQDEKFTLHNILTDIERTFGKVESRNEELFRPIYNLYMTVKRLAARTSITMKPKEPPCDLATIIENEQMDFSTSCSIDSSAEKELNSPPTSVCQNSCIIPDAYDESDHLHFNNIHALSRCELMIEYKKTKEEKRKLRNRLRLYEKGIQSPAYGDLQHCVRSIRSQYKRAKGKLRLLNALLGKKA